MRRAFAATGSSEPKLLTLCLCSRPVRTPRRVHADARTHTLSIWIKDTERYKYAALPSHRVPAYSAPAYGRVGR